MGRMRNDAYVSSSGGTEGEVCRALLHPISKIGIIVTTSLCNIVTTLLKERV